MHFEEITAQHPDLRTNLTEKEKTFLFGDGMYICHWEDFDVVDDGDYGTYYNKAGNRLVFYNFRFDLATSKPNECIIVEYPKQIVYNQRPNNIWKDIQRWLMPVHSRIMIVTLPNLEVKVDILVKGKVNKAMVKNGFLYLENGYGENQVYLKRKLDL